MNLRFDLTSSNIVQLSYGIKNQDIAVKEARVQISVVSEAYASRNLSRRVKGDDIFVVEK
jgi:hypothetical protein